MPFRRIWIRFFVGSRPEPVVRREGDKLHGSDTKGCKGGLVVAILATEVLAEVGFKQRPVMLLLRAYAIIRKRG